MLQILIALGLIGLNACFVLAEYALVRVRSSRLEILARQGNARAMRVQSILQNLDVYLSAIQMGITMASLGLGWVGEPAVARLFENYLGKIPTPFVHTVTHGISFALAFGAITFLHILMGELVPRFAGLQKSELVAMWAALPLQVFYSAFKMPVTFLAGASRRVLRWMHLGSVSVSESHLSEDEIRILLGSSEERGTFSLERMMLMENILDFGNAKVSDAMITKEKVTYLSLSKPWAENLATIRAHRLSRYPLCKAYLDSAVGYVHVKDLVVNPKADLAHPDLESLRRDIAAVAPGDSLQKLLQTFADKGASIALVKDAQGTIVGLVTLEDILEEIVGEIHDEFDLPDAWSLMDVLVSGGIEIGLEATDASNVIRRMIARIKAAYPDLDEESATRVVLEREAKFSSAVGHGLAIPHGRLSGLARPLVAIGRSPRALPFQAPDKAPVRFVFLVLTPAGAPLAQLKILARIASLISNDNLRRRLLRAKSEEHLMEILKTADTVLAA